MNSLSGLSAPSSRSKAITSARFWRTYEQACLQVSFDDGIQDHFVRIPSCRWLFSHIMVARDTVGLRGRSSPNLPAATCLVVRETSSLCM